MSIFGKNTYNQQYRFLGETGDNSGGFSKVDGAEYVTGNPISHTVSVYPYQEVTRITEDEVLTLILPAEQYYAKNSFGLGASTMVSVSSDDVLQFKSVSGYLMLKLHGEGISVTSITLRGNNGEKLAGKASVTMPLDGVPTAVMADDATSEITLICETPIQLGTSAEESTQFWFVVPPVTFTEGFTISVKESSGRVYEKSTSNSISIERNKLSKMSPVSIERPSSTNIIFADAVAKAICVENWDADGDGELSYKEAASVTSIGKVFYKSNISSFDEFIYFTGVKSINYISFYQCEKLHSITIPENLSSIAWGTFAYCSSIQRISVSDINPFYSSIDGVLFNKDLTELTCYPPQKDGSVYEVPSSVRVIADCGFFACNFLESIILHDEITTIDGAFSLCSSLKSIVIPKGVTRIGDFTFSDCSSLSEVVFHNNLVSIGQQAFVGCKSIMELNLPEGLSEIGEFAFQDCKSLQSVYLPNSLKVIHPKAFNRCVSLQSVTIQDGLPVIGGFSDCSALVSIVLPNSITTIGEQAFSGCTGLADINLPESITTIGPGAFMHCSSLISLAIPSKVTSINLMTFYDCSSLTSVTLPESVRSIEAGAFSDCLYLVSINIPNSVTLIEPCIFMNCYRLASINIPEGISDIGDSAFYNCMSLTSINLPESVTKIGGYSFFQCFSLQSIIIPREVKSIGGYAFAGCSGLKSITVQPSFPPLGGDNMFGNYSCPIYVPSGSIDVYKSAEYWSDYANRIQAISQ